MRAPSAGSSAPPRLVLLVHAILLVACAGERAAATTASTPADAGRGADILIDAAGGSTDRSDAGGNAPGTVDGGHARDATATITDASPRAMDAPWDVDVASEAASGPANIVLWPLSRRPDPDADVIRAQYGPRFIGRYDFHAGIDLPAPKRTPVGAVAAGKVVNVVRWDGVSTAGNNVLLEHGGGRFTAYLHLDSIAVQVGDVLPAGGIVGAVGDTGATYDHLHLTYMVGLTTPRNDERRSRNPLEMLPHRPAAPPTVTFQPAHVTVDLPVQQMTVRRIALHSGATTRRLDYHDVVALGSTARDAHVQFGVYLDAAAAVRDRFALTVAFDPRTAVPDRIVVEDFDGRVVADVHR